MQSEKQTSVSRKLLWTGRAISALSVLFLLFDSITKVLRLEFVVKATVQLGYPESLVPIIGYILLVCIAFYVIPRTSIFGAILLTGYLGGAVTTHVRLEDPLFSDILFPVYVGLLIWGGLFFRDDLLRTLIPFRKREGK